MARKRPRWTLRQLQELKYARNYSKYIREKVESFRAANKPVPIQLEDAEKLIDVALARVEKNDFELSSELWRDVDRKIAEWFDQESKDWHPPMRGPRLGSPPP
jgi:hypothetical protein